MLKAVFPLCGFEYLFVYCAGFQLGNSQFNGKWTLIAEKSSEIGLYSKLALEIQWEGTTVILK